MLDLVRVLFGKDFADAGERIDFADGFVRAEAHDTRKTQGVTAVMPAGALDIVEGDLENDIGFNAAAKAEILDGVG